MLIIDILLLLWQLGCILWLLRVLAAGLEELRPEGGMLFSWWKIGLTFIASISLIILDRYYSGVQSVPLTWRQVPIIISGLCLVVAKVFWVIPNDIEPFSVKYLPKLIGLMNIIVFIAVAFR